MDYIINYDRYHPLKISGLPLLVLLPHPHGISVRLNKHGHVYGLWDVPIQKCVADTVGDSGTLRKQINPIFWYICIG